MGVKSSKESFYLILYWREMVSSGSIKPWSKEQELQDTLYLILYWREMVSSGSKKPWSKEQGIGMKKQSLSSAGANTTCFPLTKTKL